jgi:Glycosyl hydrolase family 26
VVNVPMAVPNEPALSDDAAAALLRVGAEGRFDAHFRSLAERLVERRAGDAVIVLGWEMNGTTYSGRCAPDPVAWKQYWRKIVAAMRTVPGQRFRFDFAPVRGTQAVPWPLCYPGDDVVDIIGMDSYDQAPGRTFSDFVHQPYGLQAHADFAAAHGKPMSFPEWGLYDNGDNPTYVRAMHNWFNAHDVAYQSITDYCPHGVWACSANPESSRAFQELFGGSGHR